MPLSGMSNPSMKAYWDSILELKLNMTILVCGKQLVCPSMSEPFGEDDSYLPFPLRLFEGGEDDEDEVVLAPAQVNEIEEETYVELR
ncbi:hypothetical protein NL676_039385 [Syzygium grande]|nr:hypothetical protein NL676_039385 [Syzygium grande]